MTRAALRILALLAALLAAAGRPAAATDTQADIAPRPQADIAPRPQADIAPRPQAEIALGRRLFYDADLSRDGSMSCATCHEQRRAFTDGNPTHPGVTDEPAIRNVPSLDDVAFMPSLTWGDPRIHRLAAQMLIPLLGTHPVEMGMQGRVSDLTRRLGADACIAPLFRAAFPDRHGRIDLFAITHAVAAFERSLVSFSTPWDRARSGGPALPALAARGEKLFDGPAHCAICHAGRLLSDGRFHAIDRPRSRDTAALGLAAITGRAADAGAFRTPGLRNVAITAPYLHDGSATSLAAAIAAHDPRLSFVPHLSPGALAAILAFLDSLTDHAFITDPRFALPAPCPAPSPAPRPAHG